MNKSAKFFIATHRDVILPPRENTSFNPIGCGGYVPLHDLAYMDNTKDNISEKNKHYSELTGWYWIWKNAEPVDIIGLCHYRRYFNLNPRINIGGKMSIATNPYPEIVELLTQKTMVDAAVGLLNVADVIVPKRKQLEESIADQYCRCHYQDDWRLFLDALQATNPNLYKHRKLFDQVRYLVPWNMMVSHWSFFTNYMDTLFSILTWIENRRPFRTEPYQRRVPAFLAERFFTLYLTVTAPKIIEAPVVFLPDENAKRTL
jgi:hypothetical protein